MLYRVERHHRALVLGEGEIETVSAIRYDRKKAAEFIGTLLGCSISPNTLAQYASEGPAKSPPYYRIGHKVYYDHADLVAWVDAKLNAARRCGTKAS